MTITSAIRTFFSKGPLKATKIDDEQKYEKIKTNINRLKIRIRKRITNARSPKKYLRRNLLANAYSNRYLLRTNRLFKKTQGLKNMNKLKKSHEGDLVGKLAPKSKALEKRLFYSKEYYLNRYRPPYSKLQPKFAKLYISNKRKNTFTTVAQSFGGLKAKRLKYDKSFKVVFKASSGTNGFKGPKKSTLYARQDVIKTTGLYISNNYFTSIDLIYGTKAPRRGRKHLRTLFASHLIYFRSIKMTSRRPHGYVRRQKAKRK